MGPIILGLKDYEDYRRALYGGMTHKALLVDAVGTLVVPSQPMAQAPLLSLSLSPELIYRQIGEKYGVEYSEAEILNRYRRAYEQPWGRSRLRYVNDGRPFWQYIVSSSTGCSDSQYFEELYNYYTTEKAWHLCDPDAENVFKSLRNAGVKLAVVSNFDTRLRPLLRALNCDNWFDAVAVSAEVAAEKPNPTIFLKACDFLGVKPEDAVHVGDDRRNDIWGARDAGCDAWLWGSDVHSFKEMVSQGMSEGRFALESVGCSVVTGRGKANAQGIMDTCCSKDRSPGLKKDRS
ncbi:haloacid dehalogenase-like hydrolase (HAD) superfamily protein [Actinidia rufa]|uniref:Haloacid dehalogenase-like hydrolase (HAD) superfamily protein n=1 Tax=Actinidia rufa TaxID=165716 RepID=A0A7J0FHU2_9ERIC|nr:haloacid dehalogenase-like hydrolase (HAD) superfamily protein [Actinidia rufa]